MAEQLDPRLENRLRTVLHEEADAAPVTLRAQELVRLAGERGRRRADRRLSLLASAAVVTVVVGGAAVLALGRPNVPVAQSPGALGALPSYERLAQVASGGVEIARFESGPNTLDVQWQFGDLHGRPSLEFAFACSGGTVDIAVTTMEEPTRVEVGTAPCDGGVHLLHLSGSTKVANASSASALVNAPSGTAWRMLVLADAGVETASPAPSGSPFALASYAELENLLAEGHPTMQVILRAEHLDPAVGDDEFTTDLGPVGDIAYENFAISCTGGSITVNKVARGVVLFGLRSPCDDRTQLVSDGTGSVDPDAHIVVITSAQVRWRVVVTGATAEPSQGPTARPTPAASPSLPPVAQGETPLVSLDLTAADGAVTRSAARPDGTDEYLLRISCAGDGTLELYVDSLLGYWDCGAIPTEVFAPDWASTGTEVVATVTGDARFLLRLDAMDLAARPNVTWQPPVLAIRGPSAMDVGWAEVDGFAGCGAVWKPKAGGGFSIDCGPSWQPVAVKLIQEPGTSFVVSLPADWTITGVSAAIARHAAILPSGRAPAETPWAGAASGDTWTFPVPQLGDWGIRLLVSATKDGDAFQVPYYARIFVYAP